jgi:diguanylate cyclase (GGDEF)-like protein
MSRILLKSSLVAVGSVAASLLIVMTVVPALGGVVDGNAWLMSVICPLAISWPASAFTFWQGERLRRAHDALSVAHAGLAKAHRDLAEKARHDTMTGLLNRESFFAALDGSRRRGDRGVLLLIDADHFKKINDGFGHLVGDEALLAIAAACRRGIRGGDTLARIGGEEFAAFLAGADADEATGVAERIRREVEAILFEAPGGRAVQLTVSIGGTICAAEATVSDLMRAADHRLYAAKRGGRNRVMFEQDWPAAA